MSRESQLPIEPELPGIKKLLGKNRNLVLTATPGAGKTTLVPLALLDEPWLAGKRIIMLQPRRIAARMAAKRMAFLHGSPLGKIVGYQVRFDRQLTDSTRIEVLTEGLLTRRLQGDPFLEDAGLVIFDEFHERSLHTDLGLAMVREIQRTVREDLKILVMSATLETAPIAGFLDRCPIAAVKGFLHPVEITYSEASASASASAPIHRQVASAIHACLTHQSSPGDILAFLPGEGEIRRTLEELEIMGLGQSTLLLPLYGNLPLDRQDEVLRPQKKRKVVLATNIAETSLTIEGINVVVDSGWRRRMKVDPSSGLERLELERVSRDSADQRAGRAGRMGPGKVIRLWGKLEHATLAPTTPPEITACDLTEMVLELAVWGIKDPLALPWLLPPAENAIQRAGNLLRALEAIDEKGVPTSLGKSMVRLPVHPRLARILLESKKMGIAPQGADIAAVLSEKRIVFRSQGQSGARMVSKSDLFEDLDALGKARHNSFRRGPGLEAIDLGAARRVDQVSAQLQEILGKTPVGSNASPAKTEENASPETRMLKALLSGFPDRIAKLRSKASPGDLTNLILASGKGMTLSRDSAVRMSEYLVALAVDGVERNDTRVGVVYQASHVEPAWLEELFPSSVTASREISFDFPRKAVVARSVRRFGELLLADQIDRIRPEDEAGATAILCREASRQLDLILAGVQGVDQICRRLALLHRMVPEDGFPCIDQAWILENLPELAGHCRSFADLQKENWVKFIENRLGYQKSQALNRLAPEKIGVPTGSQIRLQYQADGPPILAVKLQELFGLLQTPRIAKGRIGVLIHLLSPAGRPLQITQDLESFWKNGYPALRKEMRGQYPRHPWPEDPLTAPPQRGVTRRK